MIPFFVYGSILIKKDKWLLFSLFCLFVFGFEYSTLFFLVPINIFFFFHFVCVFSVGYFSQYLLYMFTIPVDECELELMGNVTFVIFGSWFVSLPFWSVDELYDDFVSNNVVGTRYLPSPCWLIRFVVLWAVLPLRFDRVEAADVLLLFREHRREPLNTFLNELAEFWFGKKK